MENRTEDQTLIYFSKFLNFYIDALLKEHTAHHVTFIYELLATVRNAYDATEMDNMKPNTFYLAELGQLVLKEKLKGIFFSLYLNSSIVRGKLITNSYPAPITLDPLLYYVPLDNPTSKNLVIPQTFKLAPEKKPEGILSPGNYFFIISL